MPKKTASLKNRIWERDRRNRFNESFNELASLLPKHHSKNNLSKASIIQKSKEFIIQLQKNLAILEEYKDSTPKLRLELTLLTKKCELLMNILEQNGITIPTDCANISITNSSIILKEQQNVKKVKTKKGDLDIQNKSIKNKDGDEIVKIPKDKVFQPNFDDICLKEKNELRNNSPKDDTSTNIPSKDCKENGNKAIKFKESDSQVENSKSHKSDDGFPSVISPVLIVTNDPPAVSQCTILFNTTQTSKTSIQPNILVIKNSSHNIGVSCKKHKNYKKKQGNGMKKIASKGFSLDFTKTMILNKIPIPALTKTFLSENPDPMKSESDVKINSVNRVTYRVLRRTKILNKNVYPKNKQMEIKNDKINKENRIQQKDLGDLNSSTLVKNKLKLKDKNADKIQTINHRSPTTTEVINKTAITSVTYSIDSICSINSKTNDPILNKSTNAQMKLEDRNPRQQNSESKVKKNLMIPCIDNNSKNDPLSDLSNDLFASLQVAPISNHSAGCTSPTAAFLLAFPLVSTLNGGKVNQVDDNSEIQDQNAALLHVDNQKSEAQTNLMNLEQFFGSKEMYTTCEHKQSMNQKDEITSLTKDKIKDVNNKTLSLKSNIKPECLFTYTESISCTPTVHNLYNSNFDQKNEKNKFSHTNLVLDNTTTNSSCLDNPYNEHINMASQDLHHKFHTDFNHTQIKALSDLPTCSISMQNDSPLLNAYSTNKSTLSETYHSYTPFYGSAMSKDTTRLYNTKLLAHNPHVIKADTTMQDYNIFENKAINNETSNEEKTKFQNDLVGQELKYQKINETRYKPYETNISLKCKQNYARENMRDCQNLMKAPVNWMTSPDIRPTTSTLPKFNKNYIQNLPMNNFNFNNIDSDTQDSTNRKESFFIIPPSNMMDDSLNTWVSSIKMQENQSQLNLPTTLPTLIGDLALGTTTPLLYGQDNFKSNPSCYSDKKESMITMHKEEIYVSNERNCLKNDDSHRTLNSWNNSILSVSQLVDQFKSDKDTPTGDRYNVSNLKSDAARSDDKILLDNSKRNLKQTDSIGNINDVFDETDRCKNKQDNVANHHNSILKGHKKHSAEALITKQANNKSFHRQQQFFPLVDFTVDIQQDTIKEKQHSKHSNVYSIANVNYSYPNVMLTSNHVIGSEQNLENKVQQLSNENNLQPVPHQPNVAAHKGNFYKSFGQNIANGNKNDNNSSCPKRLCAKTSHKYLESSGNSMFDSNYLSAPKHSPIFSEESFYNYSSGYNPNSTAQTGYQNTMHNTNSRCHLNQQMLPFSSQIVNPVVSKTINNIPTSSPNITNNSSSLTNFNLSTIFPEINEKIRSHW